MNALAGRMKDYKLLSSKIDDDCGCLEEEYDCPVGFMSFHFKPDAKTEIVFDNGDCEWEVDTWAKTQDKLWLFIIEYVDNLPCLD